LGEGFYKIWMKGIRTFMKAFMKAFTGVNEEDEGFFSYILNKIFTKFTIHYTLFTILFTIENSILPVY
jgi:hypothetical protein